MMFNPTILIQYWQVLAHGLLVTIAVSALGMLFGFVVAVPFALMGMARGGLLRVAAALFVETVRNLPFLIFVFLVHYGLPFMGLRMQAAVSGVVALSFYGAAYYSEAIRAS